MSGLVGNRGMSKEERRTRGEKEKKEEKEEEERGGKGKEGLHPWPPCMSNGMSDPLPQDEKMVYQ